MKKKDQKAFDDMARALGKYIETMGGSASLVGSVSIGQTLKAHKYTYFIQIDIIGKKPKS